MEPNKKPKIVFIQTPTNSLFTYVYHLKNDNRVDIKQNNIPIELRMELINTFKNNKN
jgi:hypothetical protein